MDTLLVVDVEIPEQIRARGIGTRMLFMTAIERRKFDWVANEKHGLEIDQACQRVSSISTNWAGLT